jgi:hypothetical protein
VENAVPGAAPKSPIRVEIGLVTETAMTYGLHRFHAHQGYKDTIDNRYVISQFIKIRVKFGYRFKRQLCPYNLPSKLANGVHSCLGLHK